MCERMRVACFVDGFNLYHAIDDLGYDEAGKKISGKNHLKWLNLWALAEQFTNHPGQELVRVYYFSAYATFLRSSYPRHLQYVRALDAVGVTTVMAYFKEKERHCKACHNTWTSHEEKESDVRIALMLLNSAYKNEYDRAILISSDSDLAPAIENVAQEFPEKTFRIIAPVGRYNSKALIKAAGGKKAGRILKEVHIEHSLFPECVRNATGDVVARRPEGYTP